MNLGERGPTKKLGWKDYAESLEEIEPNLRKMVKEKQAYVEVEKDEAGTPKSLKIFRNDKTLLCFIDKERLDQLKKNKKI